MRRLLRLSCSLALAAACAKGSSQPVIVSFTAAPDTVHQGEAATLSWTVSGASQISLDHGVGVQQGHSVEVKPSATTTYTLTATGLSGDTTATVTVTVLSPLPKPAITQFSASPLDVPTGASSTLTWATTGTVTSLSLGDGSQQTTDVTGRTTLVVHPGATTTYTLTATNSGGSDSKGVQVKVHASVLGLRYTDPLSTTAKIRVVQSALSTGSVLVLDVKVGDAPITAFGFAMNVPLARMLPTGTVTDGIVLDSSRTPAGLVPGVIPIGSSPATGAVMLGGPSMQNFISLGVAKHKTSVSDGDDTWAAGATLFSIALKMVGTPPTGDVFIGSTVAADPAFRAAALAKDGTEAVGKADIALGDLVISL